MSTYTAPLTQPQTPSTGASNQAPLLSARSRLLLACGALASPLFVASVLVQIATRPGFSITRDAVSLLDLGAWGWVQDATFLLSGLLLLAGSFGLRQALRGGPGDRWAPRLLGLAGIGQAAAGIFHPDPSNGFPPGTPLHASAVSHWDGVMHMVCGSASFIALIALCIILGRRAAAQGQQARRIGSYLAAACGAIGVVTAGGPMGTLTLFVGISIALLWTSGACGRALRATEPKPAADPARPFEPAV